MIILLDSGILGQLTSPNLATWQDLSTLYPGQEVVIATTNVRHLSRFATAVRWEDLRI